MLPQKILNFRPSEVVSGAFWVYRKLLSTIIIELRERTGARAATCVSLYCTVRAYIRVGMRARAY